MTSCHCKKENMHRKRCKYEFEVFEVAEKCFFFFSEVQMLCIYDFMWILLCNPVFYLWKAAYLFSFNHFCSNHLRWLIPVHLLHKILSVHIPQALYSFLWLEMQMESSPVQKKTRLFSLWFVSGICTHLLFMVYLREEGLCVLANSFSAKSILLIRETANHHFISLAYTQEINETTKLQSQ